MLQWSLLVPFVSIPHKIDGSWRTWLLDAILTWKLSQSWGFRSTLCLSRPRRHILIITAFIVASQHDLGQLTTPSEFCTGSNSRVLITLGSHTVLASYNSVILGIKPVGMCPRSRSDPLSGVMWTLLWVAVCQEHHVPKQWNTLQGCSWGDDQLVHTHWLLLALFHALPGYQGIWSHLV